MIQALGQLPKNTVRTTVTHFRHWDAIFDEHVPDLIVAAIIVLFSFLLYRLIKLLTRRITQRQIEDEDPISRRVHQQRAHTMASLLNGVALVIIVVVAGLTILSTFINIAPLLASVSVVGLAISFGAQTLVKDMISGVFLLFEGQFGIGDVVKIGDTSGLVEKITLRTTVLRDTYGAVHTIPNGEITRSSNLTKSWSRAVLDVSVSYSEDVDRVIALLREIGAKFRVDPEWSALLLDDPQVLGVENFGDSSLVVRMLAKTLPLKQWDVARELRRRIKNRFAETGIEMPEPRVKLYWGEGQMPAFNTSGGSSGPAQADD
jgi:small-conductance mechanosensitive channel